MGCNLTEVPEAIRSLGTLENLCLACNELTRFPELLVALGGLAVLDLGCNRLAEVPAWIGRLAVLQELYLYSNRLTNLAEEIGGLPQLRVLELGKNKDLFTVPKTLSSCKQLEYLGVANTRFAVASLHEFSQRSRELLLSRDKEKKKDFRLIKEFMRLFPWKVMISFERLSGRYAHL